MNKDKITTLAMVIAICGCAVKMVTTLKAHGARKEIIGEVEVIDDEQ